MIPRAEALPRLWLFIDDAYELEEVVRVVRAASSGAPVAVVVRARDPSRRRALTGALAGASLGSRASLVTTGDAAEVAVLGLAGLHLGGIGRERPAAQREVISAARAEIPEGAWLSVPAHEDEGVLLARDAGAGVLVVSPVYASPGKGPARGLGAIARARVAAPSCWLVGLGGIRGPADAAGCRAAGADAVGVVRAVFDAPDPRNVAASLASVWG